MSFDAFQKKIGHSFRFNLFMLAKLPSAFFCGVRLRSLQPDAAVVSVPYRWISQNPFRSTYFACQAMAAEMSTGVLALGHIEGKQPAVSMLVTRAQGVFVKKATERIYFTCSDGMQMAAAIEQCALQAEGTRFEATSIGRTREGVVVSEFKIEWSFKSKSHARK